jgi:hypothetical protein
MDYDAFGLPLIGTTAPRSMLGYNGEYVGQNPPPREMV